MIVTYYLFRLAGFAVGAIPSRVAQLLAYWCGVAVYYSWPARRQIARDNFARVLGRPPDHPEVGRTARRAFGNYCRYILDMLRYAEVSNQEFQTRVQIEEGAGFKEALASDKPIIIVSAHFGNMDYVAAVAAQRYRRFTLAAETIKPVQLFDYLARLRSARGTDLIPYDRAPRKIVEALRRKEIVGFLIDFGVNAQKDIHTTEVHFFGERTTFPSSPAILAQRTGAPIVVASTRVMEDGTIRAQVEPPMYIPRELPREEAERQTMQTIAQQFERFISANPEQWYVFRPMWPRRPKGRRTLLSRLAAALSDSA